MVKSRLIDSLRTLNESEFRRFGAFLASPFFNTNTSLVKLYDTLKRFYPEFKFKLIGKEEIFAEIYPDIKYNAGTLRNLISDLAKLLQIFFVEIEFEKDTNERKMLLLRQLDKRKLDTLFSSVLKEHELFLNTGSGIGYSYFYQLRQLEETKITFALERGMQKSICDNILLRSEYLVFSFIIYLMNDLHDLKINEDAYNAKYRYELAREIAGKINFDNVLESAKFSDPGFSEILRLFLYEGLAFLKIEDDRYYYEFKKMFFDKYEMLSKSTINTFFTSLENICLEKTFNGRHEFLAEMLNVFKEGIRRNVYHDETKDFNIYLFRNIVLSAITNNEISWLEDLLKDHAGSISVEFREDMINFAYGLIYFEKKKFSEALEIISKIVDKAEIFKFTLYTLKLKIYYETGEHSTAEYLLDTYNHFINQNKLVSERFRRSNKDFLKVYQILTKLKTGEGSSADISCLKELLNEDDYIKEKSWLKEKAKELEEITERYN